MHGAAVLLLLYSHGRAETIDRIAATAGKALITDSDIRRDLRITAFLNGEEPDSSGPNRRKTAERLVDLALLRREMEISRYQEPELSDANPLLEQVKLQRFPQGGGYQEALAKYKITEDELKQRLRVQLATLRFIELRFRPGVQVLDTEISDYYGKQFVPEWESRNKQPAPPLTAVRGEIEEKLIAERVDRLVDAWLKEARGRERVEYRAEALQ